MPVSLLGGLSVTDTFGETQHLPTWKAEVVLAILALAGDKGVARESLAEWVWPDRSEGQAKSSLRQALTAIRKILPDVLPEYELRSERSVVILAGPDNSLDVRAFDRLDDGGSPDTWSDAAGRYAGDLFDRVEVQPLLTAWIAPQKVEP